MSPQGPHIVRIPLAAESTSCGVSWTRSAVPACLALQQPLHGLLLCPRSCFGISVPTDKCHTAYDRRYGQVTAHVSQHVQLAVP